MFKRRTVCLALAALTALNVLMARYVFRERHDVVQSSSNKMPALFAGTSPKSHASLQVIQTDDIHPIVHLQEAEKTAPESPDERTAAEIFPDNSISNQNGAADINTQLGDSPVEIMKQRIEESIKHSRNVENVQVDNLVQVDIDRNASDYYKSSPPQKTFPYMGDIESALHTAQWNSNSGNDLITQGSNFHVVKNDLNLDSLHDFDNTPLAHIPDLSNEISNQRGFQGSENQNQFSENDNIERFSADDNGDSPDIMMQGDSILNSVPNLQPPEGAAVFVTLKTQNGVMKIPNQSEISDAVLPKFPMDNLGGNNLFSPIETNRDRRLLNNDNKNKASPPIHELTKGHIGVGHESLNRMPLRQEQILMNPEPVPPQKHFHPVEFEFVSRPAKAMNPLGILSPSENRKGSDLIPTAAASDQENNYHQRLTKSNNNIINTAKFPNSKSRQISNVLKYAPTSSSSRAELMAPGSADAPRGPTEKDGLFNVIGVNNKNQNLQNSVADISQKMLDNIVQDNGIGAEDQERQKLSSLLKRLLESNDGENDLHKGSHGNFQMPH